MSLPIWIGVLLDAMMRFRATQVPLKTCIAQIAKEVRLDRNQRQKLSEYAFLLSRQQDELFQKIDGIVRRVGGIRPSARQRDLAVLALIIESQNEREACLQNLPQTLRKAVADQIIPLVEAENQNETLQTRSSALSHFPKWLQEKLSFAYGADAEELAAALMRRAGITLAIDSRKLNLAEAQLELQKLGIATQPSVLVDDALKVTSGNLRYDALPTKLQNALWLMDEGSAIVATTVGCQAGDLALDACAGGGGKTRHLLQTGATVVSMDISFARLHAAKKRPGMEGFWGVVADGLKPPFRQNTFDWILIDAPCSGSGTLRRAPDRLTRMDAKELSQFAELQKALLLMLAPLLKPSGKLVYATCSIFPEENTQVIHAVQKQLHLAPYSLTRSWQGRVRVNPAEMSHCIQLLPSKHGCDGFFVAAFQRSDY